MERVEVSPGRSKEPVFSSAAQVIDVGALVRLREHVHRVLGLEFSASRSVDLARAVVRAAREEGATDLGAFTHRLAVAHESSAQMDLFIRHVTIGETYVLRDIKAFRALEREILPERERLLASRSRIKLWSAGCATGEEVYSLAMTAMRSLTSSSLEALSIIGTDINTHFLARARSGVYGRWSFRDVPWWVFDEYVVARDGERFEFREELRRMVNFRRLNLVTAPTPYPWPEAWDVDVIVCRNVLMYFSTETRHRVIARLTAALVPGGWLMLSPTDTMIARQHPDLESVRVDQTTFFRKRGGNVTARL